MTDTRSSKTKPAEPWGNAVLVEFEDGIAWVSMNRPDKRNAMNPIMNREMNEVLDALEVDDRCRVLVLTGSGESFSAGMDLKEYFRETDDQPRIVQTRARRDSVRLAGPEAHEFREADDRHGERLVLRRRLHAHGLLRSGDRRRRGDVRRLRDQLGHPARRQRVEGAEPAHGAARRALRHHDRHSLQRDKRRRPWAWSTSSVPLAQLRDRTRELAKILLEKNPTVLHQAKVAFRNVEDMSWDVALDYLSAKNEQGILIDPERGRQQGLKQFLDDKSYRPGLKSMKRGE